MKDTKYKLKYWALSANFGRVGRVLLGPYCWDISSVRSVSGVAIFETRKFARKAQKKCCYKQTRVEKINVTVEVIRNDS